MMTYVWENVAAKLIVRLGSVLIDLHTWYINILRQFFCPLRILKKSYFHVEYQTDSNWSQISYVTLGVDVSTELFEIWLTGSKIE